MTQSKYYSEYARLSIEKYAERDEEDRNMLINAVSDVRVERVLDVGCGAGQEMIGFAQRMNSKCFGIDIGEELGSIAREFFEVKGLGNNVVFARATGEHIPYIDGIFDVVLCRVAIPYMHNERAIAEISRVLRKGGVLLLKTHSPYFYLEMLRESFKEAQIKRIAYAGICISGSLIQRFTEEQMTNGFWKGKAVFQTERHLKKLLAKYSLALESELPDSVKQSPSYRIRKG